MAMTSAAGFDAPDFFAGGGEMGALMRATDWRATPLGPPEEWSTSLKTVVGLMLATNHPMFVFWGPELIQLYNDGYRATFDDQRHPGALGAKGREFWTEMWHIIGLQIDQVMAGQGATWNVDHLVPTLRDGVVREVYWTYGYSPIREPSAPNGVGGVLVVCNDTTAQVVSLRRQRTLADLTTRALSSRDIELAVQQSVDVLSSNTLDVPFCFAALENSQRRKRTFFGTDLPGVRPEQDDPITKCLAQRRPLLVDEIDGWLVPLPHSLWPERVRSAYLLPLAPDGPGGDYAGVLVCGISPRLHFDDAYRSFFEAVAGEIGTAISLGRAYEAERRRTEALSAEGEKLLKLFAQAPSFMVLLRGPRHVFELVNAAYLQLVGQRDLLGKPVAEALPETMTQGFVELLDRVFMTGEPYVGRHVPVMLQRGRDGLLEQRFVDFVYQPIFNDDGSVFGIFVDGSDVTDMHLAQESLRSLNDNLEAQVEARTRELAETEEALRQAQKMEALGQLTGGIAHDFNNLLQAIIGCLHSIERRFKSKQHDGAERFIDGALTSAHRAAALTHRLLAFSRRQPLDPKPVAINELVVSFDELLRRTLGETIEIDTKLSNDLWLTFCDPHQLENALLNLVINARDAMPDGGTVRIETRNTDIDADHAAKRRDLPPGRYVSLCISDTGAGMAPDVIERAFDPFFTTKPLGQGTGLGLSMVYGFVRQSGGQITIESRPETGTSVIILLPRFEGDRLAEVASNQASEHTAEPGQSILVVEDEIMVRDLIVAHLKELGYRIVTAVDGPSGLHTLQSSQRIDLLLTDIGLPGLNGRQIADAARVSRPKLPVLFMTGYADTAVVKQGGLDEGMSIITKPFDFDDLGVRVREMLSHT